MKKIVLVMVLAMVMVLAACGKKPDMDDYWNSPLWNDSEEESGYEETDKVKEELGSLSDDEKRILTNTAGQSTKERIYAGNLYDSEVEKVKVIRAVKEYLAETYPDHEFRITLYLSGHGEFELETDWVTLYVEIDGVNNDKWVDVRVTEDGMEFKDNIG
ncbi:MAG: hypothetical protein MJ105_04345 [Lachnospiraceae bacterium]|nr:hypothetical protein [Lachnospiraceae bacterium]